MFLKLFVNGQFIDELPLTTHKLLSPQEQQWYIQGAVNELKEQNNEVMDLTQEEVTFVIEENPQKRLRH